MICLGANMPRSFVCLFPLLQKCLLLLEVHSSEPIIFPLTLCLLAQFQYLRNVLSFGVTVAEACLVVFSPGLMSYFISYT